jgi:anti-anti-sigma factor
MSLPEMSDLYVVAPAGRLDASAAPQLKDALTLLLEQSAPHILVNLSDVPYLSSSILRVLLWAHKRARRSGGALVLCCLPPQVLRVFKIVGFDQILTICATEEEARRTLDAYGQATAPGKEKE